LHIITKAARIISRHNNALIASAVEFRDAVDRDAVIGGDVPVVNIPGVKSGGLKLTGPVLADIYLRKIRKWNDLCRCPTPWSG